MKLTPKQRIWVAEYLKDFNATRACIAAGYRAKHAKQQAYENLAKPYLQKALRDSIEARMERLHMEQDDVLTELRVLGKSSIEHYVIDDSGEFSLAEGAPEDAMRAVSSYKRRVTEKDGVTTVYVEFRLWDKPAALNMMGRHFGMWTDKLEHSGKIEGDLSGKSLEELRRLADEYRSGK